MRDRWLPVGVVTIILFGVNILARVVTRAGGFVTESQQLTIGLVAVIAVALILIGASAWWSVRYRLGRVLADLGTAIGVSAVLSVVVGPYVGGSTPMAGGLGSFVGQLLMFGVVSFVGVALGFITVVALGKDWKSRSLRRYAENYRAKPHRSLRG
jgi:hypothetical protein